MMHRHLTSRPRLRSFVAMDLDGRELRWVHARADGGRVRVLDAAVVPLPTDLAADDAQGVGRFVGQSLRGRGVRERQAVMAMAGAEALVQAIDVPVAESDAERAAMVRFQVLQQAFAEAGEPVIDFVVPPVVSATGDEAGAGDETGTGDEAGIEPTERVWAVLAPEARVDFYRQVAAAAGLKLRRLGLGSLARVDCLVAEGRLAGEGATALVVAGAGAVEAELISGRSLGVHRLVAADDAEVAAAEIVRVLRGHDWIDPAHRIGRVLVAGAADRAGPLLRGLAGALEVPCERFEPGGFDGLDADRAGSLITALGLACPTGPRTLDLLCPVQAAEPAGAAIGRAQVLVAGCVLALAMVVAGSWFHLHGKRSRLAELDRQYDALVADGGQTERVGRRAEAIERWLAADTAWLEHWAFLSRIAPPASRMQVLDWTTEPDGRIELSVQIVGPEVIGQVADDLAAAGYGVTTGRISSGRFDPPYAYRTTIELTIGPQVQVPAGSEPEPEPEGDEGGGGEGGEDGREEA